MKALSYGHGMPMVLHPRPMLTDVFCIQLNGLPRVATDDTRREYLA